MAETTYNFVTLFFKRQFVCPRSDGLTGRLSHILRLTYTLSISLRNAQTRTGFRFVIMQRGFACLQIRLHTCNSNSSVGTNPAIEGTYLHRPIGSAIYVYGSADAGLEYSWSLNFGKTVNGTPNGNLLIAAENLITDRFSTPYTLEVDIVQAISGTRFQFNKADVVVGTRMTG